MSQLGKGNMNWVIEDKPDVEGYDLRGVQECARSILTLEDGLPVLNIMPEEAKKGRCVECLACEVECFFRGAGGGYVELPIPGLEEHRASLE